MADDFELYLAQALAPEEREPDRAFVRHVQAQVALDRRFRAERRAILRQLGLEAVGLGAITGGLLWLGRAAPVADFFSDSPALALAGLLSGFALLLLLFRHQTGTANSPQMEFQPISNT